MTAVDESAEVLSVERLGGGFCQAVLLCPQIARAAKPLQFVMVKVRPGIDPYLRRPFSLSLIDRPGGLIRITWNVVGRGTEVMANWEAGDRVSVLGPLGNGLDPAELDTGDIAVPWPDAHHAPRGRQRAGSARRLFILAGGTGLAPMLPLASAARALGWEVCLFHGARTAFLLLDTSEFTDIGCSVAVATDDGSCGQKGFVTTIAAAALPAKAGPGDVAAACGPASMLRAAKRLCSDRGLTLYVSLEQRMACGTGLCRGCAVKADLSGAERYLHVCLDGPVFRADQVDLESGGEGQRGAS